MLLKGHVPTSITVLHNRNLFQKDFEKDFQNVNRIAEVKNMFLRMCFKKIFKMMLNNSIEFLTSVGGGVTVAMGVGASVVEAVVGEGSGDACRKHGTHVRLAVDETNQCYD